MVFLNLGGFKEFGIGGFDWRIVCVCVCKTFFLSRLGSMDGGETPHGTTAGSNNDGESEGVSE